MAYDYTSEDGLARSNDDGLILAWNQIGRMQAVDNDRWVAQLRAQGVKGAHPDDGWVDRVTNVVQFAYPRFDDGVEVGDRIALGTPKSYRLVEVTAIVIGGILAPTKRYVFKEAG